MADPRTASAPHPAVIAAALGVGALLTLMLLCNSALAARTSPLFSSLAAHGVGTGVALTALVGLRRGTGTTARGRAPLWAYLGGLSGALTVVLTSAAANSALALTGTLALGLAGQMVLALAFDATGALGLARRRPRLRDLLALGLIATGAGLVLLARGTG